MSTTTEAIPIYTGGRDFYVPAFEVRLRGRPLGQDVMRDVVQVSYKDSMTDIDSFELSVNNWDAERRTYKYSDLELFDPGKELELWMGYFGRDPLRLMIKGEITSLRPNFPATGQPTLAVSGLNLLHRLRRCQVSRTYLNQTDSQIADQVARLLGLEPSLSDAASNETPNTYVFQDNQYDIVFLMERARLTGYEIYVVEQGQNGKSAPSKLFFGPSTTGQRPTYQLTAGRSLVDFQPELTTARQVGKVTVRGWDAKKKEKIEFTATRDQLKAKGLTKEGRIDAIEQSFGDREEVITNVPVESLDEAERLATGALERIAKDMVKGNGSSLGLPDLRAGSVLKIDGMGGRFSGRYFVTATTHTISDGGYATQFECRREEITQG
jgi:phage protein D